jgi:hypothetical protein
MFQVRSWIMRVELDLTCYVADSILVEDREERSNRHKGYIDRSVEFEEYMSRVVDFVLSRIWNTVI